MPALRRLAPHVQVRHRHRLTRPAVTLGGVARVRRNPGFKAQYRLPANNRQWTDAAARTGKSAIVAAAPRETGFLKQSFKTYTFPGARGPTVRYVALPEYAVYQEVGTGIYGPLGRYITPTTAKVLSWIDSGTGDRVFARRVRGTPARRYFRKGLEATFGKRNVRYYGASKLNVPQRGV